MQSQGKLKAKNEFFTYILELGLEANKQKMKADTNAASAVETVNDDMRSGLAGFYTYASKQFKKIYLNLQVQQKLLSSAYSILLAMNSGEQLPGEKLEDGFFDDLPPRFTVIIEDLMKSYGLKNG